MGKIRTLLRLLKNDPQKIRTAVFANLYDTGILNCLSDKAYLKMAYKAYIGKKLDLENPKGFNEKLQWIKLYDRKKEYIQLVDKYAVREYVKNTIGEEYLIPLLGVYNSVDEIDVDKLPEKFVLKCNHDSGSVVICKDKANFDFDAAKKKLVKTFKKNMFWWGREWPYEYVERKIIAEKYIESTRGDLPDYKFMCFNGEVKCSFVCSERFTGKGLHVTFFDLDWNVMPFERSHPAEKEGITKPQNYEKMLELAQKLSQNFPFVRVDFYEAEGKIYFGELTLFPGCGWEAFQPEEWDYTLGSWITLPEKTVNR